MRLASMFVPRDETSIVWKRSEVVPPRPPAKKFLPRVVGPALVADGNPEAPYLTIVGLFVAVHPVGTITSLPVADPVFASAPGLAMILAPSDTARSRRSSNRSSTTGRSDIPREPVRELRQRMA